MLAGPHPFYWLFVLAIFAFAASCFPCNGAVGRVISSGFFPPLLPPCTAWLPSATPGMGGMECLTPRQAAHTSGLILVWSVYPVTADHEYFLLDTKYDNAMYAVQ